MWKPLIALAVAGGLLGATAGLAAEPVNGGQKAAAPRAGERWVSSWGTALELSPPPALKVPPPPAAVIKSMSSMPRPIVPYPDTLADKTVRMIMQTSLGGKAVRIQLSNAQGRPPLIIGAAHVAIRDQGAGVVPSSDRAVTFGGKTTVTIPPGAMIVSDPVALTVAAEQELAVSLYVPAGTEGHTVHPVGLNPTYIVDGDATAATTLSAPNTVRSYFWLAGVEVLADAPKGVIVAFGDSITDGFATTPGAHATWPEVLGRRLRADPRTQGWSVINVGISGNRVRRDGAGSSALARFDRDVLSRPGVRWIALLEGVNDINMTVIPGSPPAEHTTAEQIIDGYNQFIEKAHLHGIKVMGLTITPTEGLWLQTPESEAMRQAVNHWIRTSGRFDAVTDFEAAVRDGAKPPRLRADFDPGDHIHPNDAGNLAMGSSIDLGHFTR
ncbi:SGNH/GDSL hydrolase family protein [Caulobacter sp.]|uniref:SGNH/GDSL hydrolase family protein n=1 Tax=Caulobacter sp. TaxID=78 RepID=UPI003BB18D43